MGQAKIYSSIKGFLQQAKDKAATVKVPEDVSGKLSSVQKSVSTGASSLSSSIASIQNSEGGLMTKVNQAANQAAEKLMNTEYETKVDLEEFLTYEDKK